MPIDVRGTYEAGACTQGTLSECEAKPEYPQKFVIETEDFTTGALGGTGETVSGEKVSTFAGSISGCTVKTHGAQPGYESEATYTLSADGTKLQGTFSDSYGRMNQPTFGTRASGQGCGASSKESEAEKAAREARERKEKEEHESAAKRPTGTTVTCNYEFASFQNTCVASVGDGGPQPPVTPTGTVTFTTTSGGFGSGASCTLTATPFSPQVASCTLVYQTANSGLPSITASYAGDAKHAASAGHTQYLGGGGPEETSAEAAKAPPGQYPNEVVFETTVPSPAASVEAAVQGSGSPASGSVRLPTPDPRLDPQSATELSLIGNVVKEIGNVGQTLKDTAAVNADIQKGLDRVGELLRSPDPANQVDGQILQKQTNETLEALSKILKKQNEAQQEVIKNAKGSAFSAAHHHKGATRRRARSVRSLAYVLRRNVPAGRLKLSLRLNRAALAKLVGKHDSVTVSVRVTEHLSSSLVPAGETRVILKRITLKRAPRRHKKH